MRFTHILFAFMIAVVSACASKENLTAKQEQRLEEGHQRADFTQLDTRPSSRIR